MKMYCVKGMFLASLILVFCFSACHSAPSTSSPVQGLKFQSQNWKETIELNLESAGGKPRMLITLTLLDLPEAPNSPDIEVRRNLRQAMRQSIYDNKEPSAYAQSIISDYRVQYLQQNEFLKDFPEWPLDGLNWDFTEYVNVEASPEGSQSRVFSRNRIYYLGGDHGREEKIYFVAGEGIPDMLTLDYFIRGGAGSSILAERLVRELRRLKGLADNVPLSTGGFSTDNIEVPDNFFINSEGIGFRWNTAEIAPYDEGFFEVVIPYSRLQDIMTPQGRDVIGPKAQL
ncbi:MAG: RsiV family protein [Treponema sp.]|jgi:hypothetical protein|nr:RsiV family protein [Treponema sp.]